MIFYVTFGQRYAHEEHPYLEAAHPDGFVIIEANDALEARKIALNHLGPFWCSLYDEAEFHDREGHGSYPRGAIVAWNKDTPVLRDKKLVVKWTEVTEHTQTFTVPGNFDQFDHDKVYDLIVTVEEAPTVRDVTEREIDDVEEVHAHA